MTQRAKNAELHLMFMLLVFEWQPEQNKIMKTMKKKSDKEQIPTMKITGLLPNTILTLATNGTFFLDIQPKSKKLTYYAHCFELINTYCFWNLQNITNSSRLWDTVNNIISFVLRDLTQVLEWDGQ